LRSSEDPAIAAKLLKVIEALQGGVDLDTATKQAGLDRETTDRLLKSIKNFLARNARVTKPPQKPQKLKKRSGETLRVNAVSDGASRGNPGEAACAVIISNESGEELLRRSERLGVATNNVAEYQGVILALELAQQLGASELGIKLDSELVVKQLNGEYKVKHPSLKPLFERARLLIRGFNRFDVTHVPRTQTKDADKLANDELDRNEPD